MPRFPTPDPIRLIALLLLSGLFPARAQPGISTVMVPRALLERHVAVLASPTMAGRETGTTGQRRAASYCAQMLKTNRLQPLFRLDSARFSFFQTYPFAVEEIQPYGAGGAYGSGGFARAYKRYSLTAAPQTADDSANVRFGQNIAAVLPGTDREREIVIISAHYDHLGRADGVLYPGADDNGSGTATVLSLAATFDSLAQAGLCPRRTVLFVLFSGEEGGLIGSQFFVLSSLASLPPVVCDLNVDMVGRVDYPHRRKPDYCYILAGKRDDALRKAVAEANERSIKLSLDRTYDSENDPNRYFYRSDQLNFAKAGIPALFFMDGQHPDYHKPTDTADRIDYDILQKRATLVFQTAWLLANPPD